MRAGSFLVAVAIGVASAVSFASGARAEVVKTLRAELPAEAAARFGVENLVGRMRVSAADQPGVIVTATVYGENDELAGAVRIERVTESGGPLLRVRYPYDRVRTFRYHEPDSDWDGAFLGFASSSTYHYDGRTVRVNPGRGTLLHADLEVVVPRRGLQALFRNLVGRLEAEGLEGRLGFEVESADLRLARLKGDLVLKGSSGDIRARDIQGDWRSEFSSGDCRLEDFSGESLSFRATSGDMVGRRIRARHLRSDTSSGDVRLLDAEVEELAVEATSGDIEFESAAKGLRSAEIRTSSGDVLLRLPENAGFDLETSQSSGDTRIGYADAASLHQDGHHATYRRGGGGAHIRVRTSSGDLTVRPL